MEQFFIYILKSGSVLSAFYLVYIIFLRKETFVEFNRHFLNIGLIFSLVAPFLKHKVYLNETIISNVSIPEILNTSFGISIGTETYELNLFDHLHYLYITISIVFIIRLIFSISSFYRYIKPLGKHKKGGFVFIESEDANSPFSFMNNIVYNPELFSTSELGDILNHEKEHSRQKHSYDIILMEIYRAFNWLNPVAWLYKKAIVQNLEFLADTKAIKQANSRTNYQNTMLKLSIPSTRIQIANNFYDSIIKKRISIINTNKSKKLNLMKSLLVIPAIIVFIFQFNSEIIAQNNENSPRIMTEKIEGSVSETVDKLIESTPGYGKGARPLYVIDGRLINRSEIISIPNDKVKVIAILKKDDIEQRYGKGAVETGVVEIYTNYGEKKVVQDVKIPESKRPIYIVNGKLFETDANDIDPDYIKSVNIIKDPDIAKKEYGEKGKNGVVEITLKDGITLN